jgi:hypothetical protein
MNLAPSSSQLLDFAGAASFAPILLALTLISLPIILPLVIYRVLRGTPLQDAE